MLAELLREISNVSEILALGVATVTVGGMERVRGESVTSAEGLGLLGDALCGAVPLFVARERLSDNVKENVGDKVLDGEGSCDKVRLGELVRDAETSFESEGDSVTVEDTTVLLGSPERVWVGVADCVIDFPENVTSEL